MNYLDLPLLSSDQSLADAIGRMKQSDRRAVVVEMVPQEYRIYMNHEIHRARLAGVTRLLNLPETSRRVISLEGPETGFEAQFERTQALYGLMPADRYSAKVVTRNEALARDIAMAKKICECSVDPSHIDESPPKRDGQQCDDCTGTYSCY